MIPRLPSGVAALSAAMLAAGLWAYGGETEPARAQTAPAAEPAKPAGAGAPPAKAAPSGPVRSVTVGKAERKPMPVRFDTIGAVQPISTVTVRTRVEAQITGVPFDDGAKVSQGDVLFVLDSRGIEAQIKQAEAQLLRSRAQLEQAQRDVKRNEALAVNEYASRQKLEDSRTAVATSLAQIAADEAVLENLKVSLTYYTLRSPISGRIGVAALKTGNIAKTGDASLALAQINQISPIYVELSLPQRLMPDLRQAMRDGGASVVATPQGLKAGPTGKVAVLDNTVDATTGTIGIRAVFDNADEFLWPGALCNVRITLRTDPDSIVVPKEAVQTSQTGTFVFVLADGVARVRPVTVDRTVDGQTVIASGLKGDETVVVDGQLLLTEGTRAEPRAQPRAPAAGATPAAGADAAAGAGKGAS